MLVPVLLLAMAAFGGASKRARRARSTGEALRRVFVDRLSGGETATQMRDMIVSSLQNARLFVITENQERAVVLRGSDDDLVFTDEHAASDRVHAQANFGFGGSGANSRTATRGSRSSYGA